MASRIASTSRRAAGLSLQDWRYLAIAVRELLIARIRHASQPVGKILHDLQDERLQSDGDTRRAVDLVRLSWAISAAAARVPWRSDCVLQAMAADHWLRRYGMASKFFVGVAKDAGGKLESHAWLQCGEVTVTGANDQNFTCLIEPISQPAQE
jgi:Transglutaminase-like superfamily